MNRRRGGIPSAFFQYRREGGTLPFKLWQQTVKKLRLLAEVKT